ncbi:Hypothetical protein, putative [Bodo saltans]|uniref:Uncharacterized protein n=1 Tax=Bodo saltans TaxID=75058 RepID=A0A0S4JQ85_BODSA|nr:Hypothetical protein, putative [Bodo saltans]|eukprot:CUG91462.1 Hypothetical protein, putative [Bodo saltans]
MERKVGISQIAFMMRTQTKYRVELASYWRKTVVRKGIDSAAVEHGSGWGPLKNDLARQNILLLPSAQAQLARYEPLAFRAVMELCASRIAPLQPPTVKPVPEEAYAAQPSSIQSATPAATRELREKLNIILSKPSPAVAQHSLKTVDAWLDAWKQFEVIDQNKRLAYRK